MLICQKHEVFLVVNVRRFVLFLSFALWIFASLANAKVWFIGGYLPEQPQSKVYLTIDDGKIVNIGRAVPTVAPDQVFIESESWIFPGLIDMHNHPNFNAFPFWNEAKGQFNNRFEWQESAAYKAGPKIYMQGLKKDPVYSCAAARWAEMKAIAGGVTAIQGSSGAVQRDCAAKFGARNLEYDGEMNSERKLKINFELVSPSFIP